MHVTFTSVLLYPAYTTATPITLASTQDESGVCYGDTVVFTCNVTGSGTLEWTIESLFPLGEVGFYIYKDRPGSVLVPESFPEVINVTLISADQNPMHNELGNLSSQITVLVTNNTLGKNVSCSDRIQEMIPSIPIMKQCKM